jgi:PAS domain S-box-containing protein
MSAVVSDSQTTDELRRDNESLRERLRIDEETLHAIRNGEVDSLVAQTPRGPRIFTLGDAYAPYRTFVEAMQHAAVTVNPDGTVMYCNQSLPALLHMPIERLVGAKWQTFVAHESATAFQNLLDRASVGKANAELNLRGENGIPIPVSIFANPLSGESVVAICLVITDLTERKRAEDSAQQLAVVVQSTEDAFLHRLRDNLIDRSPASSQEPNDRSVLPPNVASRLAQIAAAIVIAIGGLVLCGWLFDVTFLKSVFAGLANMKPNTALGFVFAGAGCMLAALDRTDPRLIRWRSATAMAAVGLGALTMFEWLTEIDLGIDRLLFRDDATVVGTIVPGRMTPWTALNLIVFGTAILLIDVRRAARRSISQTLALLGCLPLIVSLLGYAFRIPELYGLGLNAHIAIHTSVAFLFLAVGILAARPEWNADQSALKDYGIAILAVTLAFLPRWLFWPLLGTAIPFLTNWPAIIIAAWYGGFRAGFLATLLSAIGTAFFLFEPRYSLAMANPSEQFGLGLFLLLGVGLSLMLERAKKAEYTLLVTDAETRAIRAASVYNRSLIEASLDPLVTIGYDGRITDVNTTSEMITGCNRQELIGRDFADFFVDPDKARAGYHEAFCAGIIRDYALEIRHKNGHVTPVMYNASVYRDATGQVLGVFAAARDITERIHMEVALAKRAEALESSNKELEHFAYIASHDLQEPLRMITSFAELLAKRYQGKIDEKADKFIHYIVDGAMRMHTLINDLLTFSRVATRAKPFALTSSETALAEVLANLQIAIADKGAIVTHDPLPDVIVDSTQFEQVLQNLIANALKFCDRKPQVHLGAIRQGDEWRFSVQDNGIGIANEHMDRLFVIFQRLHSRSEYPGTGIGLAVCKKVVERHGGRIWIESVLGHGSTFYFTIPVREANL